jgi:NAD+ diphosphatase
VVQDPGMAFEVMAYTATPHDRVPGRRGDPDWVVAQLAGDDTRVVPMWRDRALLDADGHPVTLTGEAARTVATAADQLVLLGLDGATPVFAADLSGATEAEALALTTAASSADLRALVSTLTDSVAATHAYARGLLYWHRQTRFCGACGGRTASVQAGHVRECQSPGCERQLFPRIEPAVIALIESPDPQPRCLLARHRGAGPDSFALLAGFVEVGESLESAVRREAAEEAGVTVSAVAYRGSQAWPFPAGLMIGFVGRAVDSTIEVDGDELVDARWFTRAEVIERIVEGPGSGPVDSIGGRLLRSWAGLDT